MLKLKVIVTGAAGFIGSHLLLYLNSKGYTVKGIDNFSNPNRKMLKALEKEGLKILKSDVRDYQKLSEEVRGYDLIVHSAALISVEDSIRRPHVYSDNNVTGTVSTLKAAVSAGVKRFVFLSSAAVYGAPKKLPISEDHPLNPISPYGASKLAGEVFVKAFSKAFKIEHVILRLFNVYGPGQESSGYAGVIAEFIKRVKKGKPPIIFGDGNQTRDFIYIRDVVEAVEKVISKNVVNETLNIGTGVPTSIRELAYTVIDVLKASVEPVHASERPGDIRESWADISKCIEKLKFKPKYTVREGLREIITLSF